MTPHELFNKLFTYTVLIMFLIGIMIFMFKNVFTDIKMIAEEKQLDKIEKIYVK
jgi:hypothetical protein